MSMRTWRKSSRSGEASTCVELLNTLDALRDSKNVAGPELPVAGLRVFVRAVKAGAFDPCGG